MPSAPDLAVIGLRALAFIAGFQGVGISLFLTLYGPRLTIIERDLRRLAAVSAVVGIVATLAQHTLGPARFSGAFGDVFDLSLQRFLLESAAGTAHVARVAGLALVAYGIAAASRYRRTLAVAGATLTIASFALMGHTTTHDPALLLRPLLLLHVAAVAFWFGALAPLRAALEREPVAIGIDLVECFSALAIKTVPLLFAAGLVLAVLLIRDPARVASPYAWTLLGKLAGFALLLSLASLNRWRLAPALRADRNSARNKLRTVIAVEWALIAAVLVVTAALTTLFSPGN